MIWAREARAKDDVTARFKSAPSGREADVRGALCSGSRIAVGREGCHAGGGASHTSQFAHALFLLNEGLDPVGEGIGGERPYGRD